MLISNYSLWQKYRNYSFLRSSIPSQQHVAISGMRTCNWSAIDKVYFVRYILSGIYCPVYFVWVFFVRVRFVWYILSGIFCRVYFVRYILSVKFCPGTYCPVYFVRYVLSWYILSGIFCPGIFVRPH